MKTKIRISALFLLWSITLLTAQLPTIGFRIGVTGSKINFSDKQYLSNNQKEKPLMGPSFTGFYEKSLESSWTLQAELSLIKRGLRFISDETYSGRLIHSDTRLSFLYLEVAALPKYNFGSQPRFGLLGGVGINYMLGGKTKSRASSQTTSTSTGKTTIVTTVEKEVNFAKDNINRLDISLPLGASAAYNLKKVQLSVDVRYMFGFLDISNETPKEETSFNRGWGISVGAMMPIESLMATKPK